MSIPPTNWTESPSEVFFKGRPADPRLGERVLHHREEISRLSSSTGETFVIAGFPDDRGVRINLGRPGAAKGPDSIRKFLYRFPTHATKRVFHYVDQGNLILRPSIRDTHGIAQTEVRALHDKGWTPIILGGGHDYAFPTFAGAASSSKKIWGLINVDPHLDLRPDDQSEPNSGTAFRRCIESGLLAANHLVEFGVRRNRNSEAHWTFAEESRVRLVPWEGMRSTEAAVAAFKRTLDGLDHSCDQIGLSLDMDSCFEAEGTSAAPVLGFSADALAQFGEIAGRNLKVRYLEIAEVAPDLDPTERSSRIAAEIIHAFIDARIETLPG